MGDNRLIFLTTYYRRIYKDLPENWRVFAFKLIKDKRQERSIIEIEGGECEDGVFSNEETFLMELTEYNLILAREPEQLELKIDELLN
jgi:predicted DNA binding protein